MYNGSELDEDTNLTLAMNNYRASGAGGYEFYTDCKVVHGSYSSVKSQKIK